MRVGNAKCGDHTKPKVDDFRGIAQMLLRVCKGAVPRRLLENKGTGKFIYFDMNAGPGNYPDLGTVGSPVAFLELAGQYPLTVLPYLFEGCPCTAGMLHAELADRELSAEVVLGDHQLTAPAVARRLDEESDGRDHHGLIFVDPNGEFCYELPGGKTQLPIATLKEIAALRSFYRVDILVNVGATAYKRMRGAGLSNRTLEADLLAIGKRGVLIRTPRGSSQWAMALLTNWPDMPAWKNAGFAPISSPAGRATLDALSRSYDEAQAPLFGDAA